MFWREVLDNLFVGCSERVPFIRHDLCIEDWAPIGNILDRGFLDANYFPTRISRAFIIYCLFGDVPNDIILRSFLEFLWKTERDVVNAALKGSPPNIYKDEEFIDVLERFYCRPRVYQLNVYGIILELARTFPKKVLDDINMATRSRRLKTAPFV